MDPNSPTAGSARTCAAAKFDDSQRDLLRHLIEAGCVLLRDASKIRYGLNTPIYFDLRSKLYFNPSLLWSIGGQLARLLISERGGSNRKQSVIGIPESGTPLALATVLHAWREEGQEGIYFGLLRAKERAYPGGKIEFFLGDAGSGVEYTLIDDVMASGNSKLASIERLLKLGLRVKRVIVFVDRQQGGTERLQAMGVKVCAVFRLTDIIEFYYQEGFISASERDQIAQFIQLRRFN